MPLAIIGLTLVMLVLTLLPSSTFVNSELISYDKIGHLILFGSWTYILGLYHDIQWESSTNLWVICLIGITFGLAVEVLQYLLPLNRHGDWADLLADTVGCLIAVWALKKTIPSE
ncbi:VanZ family protein [Fodinibius saliphilus]|uniref:VanZ family protein n=1 Tax=Fodinibius saliphilus TaxID=1920650 RepID=UPI001BB0FF3A|nr:VanZ family protein [Fodinibius saliphilus]